MAEVNESRMAEFVGTGLYVLVVCLFPVRVDTTAITVSGLIQGAAYVSLLNKVHNPRTAGVEVSLITKTI